MKLRGHLFLLTLATLLPMIVFAVVASVLLAKREQVTFQRGAQERTRALLTAVDAELKSSLSVLSALAVSRNLDSDDLHPFHTEATRVLASQPDWLTTILALPSAQQIVNAALPYGGDLPPTVERRSFDEVVRTGHAGVGHLGLGPITERGIVIQVHAFPIRVPVVRHGAVKYVLSGVVKPRAIGELLAAQRLPSDWVGVVLDGNFRIVARTMAPERSVGQLASEGLRAALARSAEGWFQGRTLEGIDVYTAYDRSAASGWSVAVGIPAVVVNAGARQTTWAMALGVLSAVALAFGLALTLGRRISKPIGLLAAATKSLGRVERSEIPQGSRVEEISTLGRVLEEAGTALWTYQTELERKVEQRTAELVASESRYRRLIEDCMVGIAIGQGGTVRLANTVAARMLGYKRTEALIGLRAEDLFAPEFRDEVRARVDARLRGEAVPAVVQIEALKQDGTRLWVEGAPTMIMWEGVPSTLVAFMDISDRRGREAAERQRGALQAVAYLANATAHEINNPLAVISGRLQMLQMRLSADTPESKWIEQALGASQRLHEIVRRMERITRLEYLEFSGNDTPPALDIRKSSPESENQPPEAHPRPF